MSLTHSFLSIALLGAEWVMWLLVGLSVISIAIMLERISRSRTNQRCISESASGTEMYANAPSASSNGMRNRSERRTNGIRDAGSAGRFYPFVARRAAIPALERDRVAAPGVPLKDGRVCW